jgi:hypothetical protein
VAVLYDFYGLCPTRRPRRTDVLNAVRYRFTDLFEVLTMIILQSAKSEERAESIYLHKKNVNISMQL